jgi:hypothetical protein
MGHRRVQVQKFNIRVSMTLTGLEFEGIKSDCSHSYVAGKLYFIAMLSSALVVHEYYIIRDSTSHLYIV